jgi:hypothetical protein
MRPFDYFSESLDSLRKHTMRALLTMLRIIVGVSRSWSPWELAQAPASPLRIRLRFLASNSLPSIPGPLQALVGSQSPFTSPTQQETRLAVSYASNQLADNFVMGVTASYARPSGTTRAGTLPHRRR